MANRSDHGDADIAPGSPLPPYLSRAPSAPATNSGASDLDAVVTDSPCRQASGHAPLFINFNQVEPTTQPFPLRCHLDIGCRTPHGSGDWLVWCLMLLPSTAEASRESATVRVQLIHLGPIHNTPAVAHHWMVAVQDRSLVAVGTAQGYSIYQ